MALILGTNCGFVTEAPVDDPDGGNVVTQDYLAKAQKFTSPATATRITEIGWWCDTASEEANFDVGIYTHNSGTDAPDTLIGSSGDVAKGTTAGWKNATGLSISILPSTVYWIAVVLDDTITTTYTDYDSRVSGRYGYIGTTETPLPEDGSGYTMSSNDRTHAIYAVWEAAGGVTFGGLYGKALSGSLGGRGV